MKDCIELRQFDCLTAYVDYCDSVTHCNFHKGSEKSSDHGSAKWTGTKSYEHASKLVREGWAEGVRKVMTQMSIISEGKDFVEMQHNDFDIIGVCPIVPAYLTGDPECMFNPCAIEERPIVNVVLDVSANAGVKPDHIVNRGAAILMFCSALEQNGQRVAIHCSNVSRDSAGTGLWFAQITQVKAAHLDFNIHTLSYAMVNPSMLRRHSFRCTEGLPKEHAHRFQCGYGQSASLDEIEGISASIGDVDLYSPCITDKGIWNTVQGAVDSVESMASEQGLIA